MGSAADNVQTTVSVGTGLLPPQYRLSGITTNGSCWYAQEGRCREDLFEDTLDKPTPGKERLQVPTAQLPCFPSNKPAIPEGAVTHSAASGPRILIMRQGIQSLFTRVADFLRRRNGSTAWPASSPAGRSSTGPLAIIGLVTGDEDRRLLYGICNRNGWHLFFAETCDEARAALDKLKAPVILCDRDLPGKGWRETVEGLASSSHRACIILVSGVLDAYLWDEVVRTGGYDVLYKPLREDDVVRSVKLAWSYWNSSKRTADLPGKRRVVKT